jgi:DNA-directed RNA polymerase specialized sigma24 family protein
LKSPPEDLEGTLNLLEEARSGNDTAVELLCRRYLSSLQRWARGRFPARTPDATATDDLVRDALEKALPQLDALEHLRTGTLLSHLRHSVLDRIHEEAGAPEPGPPVERWAAERRLEPPSPIEERIGRAAVDRYEKALVELQPRDREAAIARIEMGLDYHLIAELLGSPDPDAARAAVSQALLRLARAMEGPRGS